MSTSSSTRRDEDQVQNLMKKIKELEEKLKNANEALIAKQGTTTTIPNYFQLPYGVPINNNSNDMQQNYFNTLLTQQQELYKLYGELSQIQTQYQLKQIEQSMKLITAPSGFNSYNSHGLMSTDIMNNMMMQGFGGTSYPYGGGGDFNTVFGGTPFGADSFSNVYGATAGLGGDGLNNVLAGAGTSFLGALFGGGFGL